MEYTEAVKNIAEKQVKTFKKARLGQALFIAQMSALITSPYFFPDNPVSFEVAITYIIMTFGFMLYNRKIQDEIQTISLLRSVGFAILGFWVTWAIVLLFYGVWLQVEFPVVAVGQIGGIVLTQMLFVAPSEELVFRLAIPNILKSMFVKQAWILPIIYSQTIFAMFHITAYQGNITGMFVAFVIGMLWYFACRIPFEDADGKKRPIGIGLTIGSHVAYNLTVGGVLAGFNYATILG